MSIRGQIEEIHDRDLIYARAGAVHVESIVETQYPHVNISTLVDCLTDQLFDWSAATDDYERWNATKAEPYYVMSIAQMRAANPR